MRACFIRPLFGVVAWIAASFAAPHGVTATEPVPARVEAVPAPPGVPNEPILEQRVEPGPVYQGPLVTRLPAVVAIDENQPDWGNRALPINLATALRLSDARPIMIAAAQASARVAASQLQRAQVLWLPNLNVGASYYRHDGGVQGSSGEFYRNGRNQFMAGGGAWATVETTDAFYAPLAARQVLRSRRFNVQAARNDTLLAVAESYFNVQQARGKAAGFADSVNKGRALVKSLDALAAGLVPPYESHRARTLLASLSQSAAKAEGEWGIASAELTRTLRLDPTVWVVPVEAPHLQLTLIELDQDLDRLITIGLTQRPELASQQALVQATLVRLRQERMRPLMPSLVLSGNAVPAAPGGYLMGGVFASSNDGQSSPVTGRNDVNLQMLWGVNNLGLGNRAMIRERSAQQRETVIELFKLQDLVAEEVAKAHAQLEAASARIAQAETGVKEAQVSYAGNVKGMSQTTRFGDLLILVTRPQEVVAALQQLADAYNDYFTAINDYNRGQFRLYRALGFASGVLAYERSLGAVEPVDTTRPAGLPPVCAPAGN